MAATKTNPVHLVLQVSRPYRLLGQYLVPPLCQHLPDCPNFAQAAAGVVLTGVGYYSLFKSDRDPNSLHTTADRTTVAPTLPDQTEVVRAIDEEAANSSNQYWGIKKG